MSATQRARQPTEPDVAIDGEAAHRPGDARFWALAEACDAGVVVHDRGVLIAANARAAEISGYAEGELLGMRIEELVTAESRDELYAAYDEARVQPYEVTVLRKNGSTTRVEVRAKTFVEDGRQLRVATITDIQRRSLDAVGEGEVDAQLKQQQRLESIGMLAASVAHEINNPITGIINYAELIRRRIGAIDDSGACQLGEVGDRLLDATAQIEREASRVGEMVRDLLSFARPEHESTRLVRVADVVQGTLALLRVVVSKDQIELEIDIPGDLPLLRCQPQQIQQVLLNLVSNAKDALNLRFPRYDERKRIRVLARELDEDERRRWVRITVEDQGVGIAPDKIARIFTPFFTTKGKQQGTGLGLALSRAIVAEHRGRLDVESEVSAYTRFFIDLPVSDPLRPLPSIG